MVTYDILETFEAVLAIAFITNALQINIKHSGDCSFLDIYVSKRRGKKLRLGEAVLDLIGYFTAAIVMVYVFLGVLPQLFDIKDEIVKGVVRLAEKPARTHWVNIGTIVIQDETGELSRIKHVCYDSDNIVDQTVEIIKLSDSIGDSLVIKCNGEYTDFYKNHYWTPVDIKRITRKFLMVYIPFSIGFSIWLIRRNRNSFQKEKEKLCFLKYSRIEKFYYLWITANILYKANLIFALFELGNTRIMNICLCTFYLLYKLGYYIYVMSRYYYLTIENEEVIIKCRWKKDESYPMRSFKTENSKTGHYLKILLPNGKKGTIYKNNVIALKLAQKC